MLDSALATLSREDHILVFLYSLRIHQRRGMATVETYAFDLEFVALLVGADMNDELGQNCSYDAGSPIKDLSMDFVNQLSATSPRHIQTEIRIISSLYILPQTRKEKENFSYIYYIEWIK